jgi:hypothetical protein
VNSLHTQARVEEDVEVELDDIEAKHRELKEKEFVVGASARFVWFGARSELATRAGETGSDGEQNEEEDYNNDYDEVIGADGERVPGGKAGKGEAVDKSRAVLSMRRFAQA